MTELEYLDRQQELATHRVERALLGDGLEARIESLERAAVRQPWLAVGTAVALGGLVGVLLGRSSSRKMIGRVSRFAGRPLWEVVRRSLRT